MSSMSPYRDTSTVSNAVQLEYVTDDCSPFPSSSSYPPPVDSYPTHSSYFHPASSSRCALHEALLLSKKVSTLVLLLFSNLPSLLSIFLPDVPGSTSRITVIYLSCVVTCRTLGQIPFPLAAAENRPVALWLDTLSMPVMSSALHTLSLSATEATDTANLISHTRQHTADSKVRGRTFGAWCYLFL
ncbi:hypothetical protein ARMGADRAFT_1070559 [Armillaria gallica]|uniref:Uncharacterized protein n=1 Tax=Armillaria gallica TaxID=47427 RepID=A0A2H3E9H0_ARMGA|nr:hypothetical protein ARMGADRAFT_1070559 [Armillaria gallica]